MAISRPFEPAKVQQFQAQQLGEPRIQTSSLAYCCFVDVRWFLYHPLTAVVLSCHFVERAECGPALVFAVAVPDFADPAGIGHIDLVAVLEVALALWAKLEEEDQIQPFDVLVALLAPAFATHVLASMLSHTS